MSSAGSQGCRHMPGSASARGPTGTSLPRANLTMAAFDTAAERSLSTQPTNPSGVRCARKLRGGEARAEFFELSSAGAAGPYDPRPSLLLSATI